MLINGHPWASVFHLGECRHGSYSTLSPVVHGDIPLNIITIQYNSFYVVRFYLWVWPLLQDLVIYYSLSKVTCNSYKSTQRVPKSTKTHNNLKFCPFSAVYPWMGHGEVQWKFWSNKMRDHWPWSRGQKSNVNFGNDFWHIILFLSDISMLDIILSKW